MSNTKQPTASAQLQTSSAPKTSAAPKSTATATERQEQRTLHLIPVGLSNSDPDRWLPQEVQALGARLTTYIAENAKTARAFLKHIKTQHALRDITIHTLDKHTRTADIQAWLNTAETNGEAPPNEIGLVSEAGCPAVADPGAQVVRQAHHLGFRVMPWVGPSSILLALMASGLNGQCFAFHGYAPVKPHERSKQLKQWEQQSQRLGQTQLLIETPYRNDAMFASLLKDLHPQTTLCVACDLTSDNEWIQTHTVDQWRQRPKPDLNKRPTLFLFLA